jgi:hypothetical protein
MKKSNNSKKGPAKKKEVKAKDLGELKKPSKLKPLKGKEKKNLKGSFNEEEEFDDLMDHDDLKLDDFSADSFDNEDEEFFEDEF